MFFLVLLLSIILSDPLLVLCQKQEASTLGGLEPKKTAAAHSEPPSTDASAGDTETAHFHFAKPSPEYVAAMEKFFDLSKGGSAVADEGVAKSANQHQPGGDDLDKSEQATAHPGHSSTPPNHVDTQLHSVKSDFVVEGKPPLPHHQQQQQSTTATANHPEQLPPAMQPNTNSSHPATESK